MTALRPYEPGGEAAWVRGFRHAVAFRPRFAETDALGHVSNVVYPTYFELARLSYFRDVGDPDRGDAAFDFQHVAAEMTIRFLRPCFYDEELRVHARVAVLGRTSATIENALVGAADPGDLRAIARIAIVRVEHDRPIPWTERQRARLAAFEGRPLEAAAP